MVAGSNMDASVLRKIYPVLTFERLLLFFKTNTMVSGYKGWKVAWMPLFGPCLLRGDSLDSFVHPRALPGHPRHSACSLLYFTKIHNLQVHLLYHIVISWEKRALSTDPSPSQMLNTVLGKVCQVPKYKPYTLFGAFEKGPSGQTKETWFIHQKQLGKNTE